MKAFFNALLITWLLPCMALALSPPHGGWQPPPSYEDIWKGVDHVFFGEVINLRLIEDSNSRRNYIATLKVRKTWKGSHSEVVEVKLMLERGDGLGYGLHLGDGYVFFLKYRKELTYAECIAPFTLEPPSKPTLYEIFGSATSGTEAPPPGGRPSDNQILRAFLASKEEK